MTRYLVMIFFFSFLALLTRLSYFKKRGFVDAVWLLMIVHIIYEVNWVFNIRHKYPLFTRLAVKKRRAVKCISVLLSVIENLAVTLALWAFISTFYFDTSKDLLVYLCLPLAVPVVGKFVLDVCATKMREGGCAYIAFKLIARSLFYLSIYLISYKVSSRNTDLTWAGAIIPLWILLAINSAFVLVSIIFFVFKLFSICAVGKTELNDLLFGFWAMLNIGGSALAFFLLLFGVTRVSNSKAIFEDYFWHAISFMILVIFVTFLTLGSYRVIL
jgi:hypothetical protein